MANNKRTKKVFTKDNVIPINDVKKPKKIQLLPRNLKQEQLIEHLNNDEKNIILATGPAGSGKTLVSTLWAMKKFQEKKFSKIVITRPNVAVDDKDIGFLPGDIFKKMSPWMAPILDIFKEYYSVAEVEEMIKNEVIEIVPIAFIRGRTFKNAIIIIDEAQGTTVNSILAILTRIGENSKMIVTGDPKQTDKTKENGLVDFIYKLKNSDKKSSRIEFVEFDIRDVERHPVVKDILYLYKDYEPT